MDIPAASMQLASANTLRSFGIGMIRQSMDQLEIVGEQMAQMIQQTQVAVSTTEGTRINILA